MKIIKINGHEARGNTLLLDVDYESEKMKKFGKFPMEKVSAQNENMVLDYMESVLVAQVQKGRIL